MFALAFAILALALAVLAGCGVWIGWAISLHVVFTAATPALPRGPGVSRGISLATFTTFLTLSTTFVELGFEPIDHGG
jgi:hypothetical protein